jgi:hypothetical protein
MYLPIAAASFVRASSRACKDRQSTMHDCCIFEGISIGR